MKGFDSLCYRAGSMVLLAAMLGSGMALAADAASSLTPPPDLGTLFYSGAERASLTRSRAGEEVAQPVARVMQMTLNGIVRRDGGNGTLWINTHPVLENQVSFPGVRVAFSSQGLAVNGQLMRVGETMDLKSQQRRDIVSPGSIKVKP